MVICLGEGAVPGLVVAPEEGDAVGVLDLQAEQVFEGLDGVIAPVNKVSDEDVAAVLDVATCMGRLLPVRNSSRTS